MIRNVEPKDIPRLKELHAATGFEWDFPEFPMLSAKVWVNEHDEPLMMVGAKVIAEAVLISSKEGTPGMRLAILHQLFQAVTLEFLSYGLKVGIAWLPNEIWKPFSRRLKALGWKENKYRTMSWEG